MSGCQHSIISPGIFLSVFFFNFSKRIDDYERAFTSPVVWVESASCKHVPHVDLPLPLRSSGLGSARQRSVVHFPPRVPQECTSLCSVIREAESRHVTEACPPLSRLRRQLSLIFNKKPIGWCIQATCSSAFSTAFHQMPFSSRFFPS